MDWYIIEERVADTYSNITAFSGWSVDDSGTSVVSFQTETGDELSMPESEWDAVYTRLNLGAMRDAEPHSRLLGIFQEAGLSEERPSIKEMRRQEAATRRQVKKHFGAYLG